MATLKNRSRREQTYNLPHDAYCSDGQCRCVPVTQHFVHHDAAAGVSGVAAREKNLSASIIFLSGETKDDLPETILKCPDISGAIKRRELVKVD
jgi:hypothetical protein